MLDYSADLESALLDRVEGEGGASAKLRLFSSAQPANLAAADPAGLLVELTLPADWMQAAAARTALLAGGPWTGDATGSGNALSWRLCKSDGTAIAQGSVSNLAGTGDLKMPVTAIGAGMQVRVTQFTIALAGTVVAIYGTATLSPAGDTITATGSVGAPPQQVGNRGLWSVLKYHANPGGTINNGGWDVPVIDYGRDVFYYMNWGGVFNAYNLGTGEWYDAGSIEPTRSGGTHNRGKAFDVARQRILVTNGTYGIFTKQSDSWWSPADNSRYNYNGPAENNTTSPGYQNFCHYRGDIDRWVSFGGWGGRPVQTLRVEPAGYPEWWVNVPGVTGTPPNYDSISEKWTAFKSFHDTKRDRYCMVSDYPTRGRLFSLNGALTTWSNEQIQPTLSGEMPSPNCWWVYSPDQDAAIGFVGSASEDVSVAPQPAGAETRSTWRVRLDQTPLRYEKLASYAAGDPDVPLAMGMKDMAMVYDQVRKRCVAMLAGNGYNSFTLWTFTPPPLTDPNSGVADMVQGGDTITAYGYDPSGGVPQIFGTMEKVELPLYNSNTNYKPGVLLSGPWLNGLPWGRPNPALGTSGNSGGTKHLGVAYAPPPRNRLVIYSGDSRPYGTNADVTFSMDLATKQWRFDVGKPFHGYVAPHGLSDGMGFDWMPSRNKFVAWPGAYWDGTVSTNPYAYGLWMLDIDNPAPTPPDSPLYTGWAPSPNPAPASTWTQDTRIWSAYGQSSGMQQGGIYDPDQDVIWSFLDYTAGYPARRYSLASMTRLTPDINLAPGFAAVTSSAYYGGVFGQSKPVRVGRWVYIVGGLDRKTDRYYVPALWRVLLDPPYTVEDLPGPPDVVPWASTEVRLSHSNGHIIYPQVSDGMNGIVENLWVYNIAQRRWYKEGGDLTGLRCNSPCSLEGDPEGRAMLCGGDPTNYLLLIKY